MQRRIDELDFLKGVFFILMITFHLVYIGDSYPYAKRVVYTFHMPGFLIISGYLMNITKPCKELIKTMLGYAIPYIVMEGRMDFFTERHKIFRPSLTSSEVGIF